MAQTCINRTGIPTVAMMLMAKTSKSVQSTLDTKVVDP